MDTIWSNEQDEHEEKNMITHIKSSGAISMSPELFEKLYLTPKTPESGKAFANPTAMGTVGFVISTFTFAMVIMGWGGANGLAGVAGIFFFTGPVLLILSVIFEFILAMMVCALFAAFWLSFGLLQLPTLGLAAAYAPAGTAVADLAAASAASKGYNAVVGLYLIVVGFALGTFWVFTFMTNVVFAGVFGTVTIAAWVLAGAYPKVSTGDYVMAGHLQTAGGALVFVTATLGWYMVVVIMAAEMRMSVNLPVGDLSHLWKKRGLTLGQAEQEA